MSPFWRKGGSIFVVLSYQDHWSITRVDPSLKSFCSLQAWSIESLEVWVAIFPNRKMFICCWRIFVWRWVVFLRWSWRVGPWLMESLVKVWKMMVIFCAFLYQVWPLTLLFQFAVCKIPLICLEGWSMLRDNIFLFCSSQQPPCFGLRPLKGYSRWHGALQGPSTLPHALLPELERYKVRCGPWTPIKLIVHFKTHLC